jgi:hypothetical protein
MGRPNFFAVLPRVGQPSAHPVSQNLQFDLGEYGR